MHGIVYCSDYREHLIDALKQTDLFKMWAQCLASVIMNSLWRETHAGARATNPWNPSNSRSGKPPNNLFPLPHSSRRWRHELFLKHPDIPPQTPDPHHPLRTQLAHSSSGEFSNIKYWTSFDTIQFVHFREQTLWFIRTLCNKNVLNSDVFAFWSEFVEQTLVQKQINIVQ